MTESPDMRQLAIDLAARGFRVFPISQGGKTPALAADWKRIATTDHGNVMELWTDSVMEAAQPYNIGVALNLTDLVVDVDIRNGKVGAKSLHLLETLYEALPPTRETRSASGGRHLWFKVPPGLSFKGRLADDIDLKCFGRFVVAPGSVIPGVGTYEWANDILAADAPQWLIDLARAAPREKVTPGRQAVDKLDTPAAIAMAVDWLQHKAPNTGTYAVAARVKDFGISQEQCLELLMEHWVEPRDLGKDYGHVEFRVANAYRYGQNAIGSRSAEAEFADSLDQSQDRDLANAPSVKRKGKLYYERWRDIEPSHESPHLIDGWYDYGAMVVTYGDSNVGKTNVVMSQAFAIATGEPWCGSDVRHGLVVYVAAEGGRGLKKRAAAYRKKFGKDDIPFALVPCPVDLWRPTGDTKALIALIKQAEADFGLPCVMVVLDTLARVLAGGNENASEDMGALVMHCDRLRDATGATVHLIHHSGKNQAAGARGHSSLRAATDTEIEIGEGGSIKGTKQRDMDGTGELHFDLEVVTLGTDSRGRNITSVVAKVRKATEFEAKLTARHEAMLDVLETLMADEDGEIKPDKAVTWATWWEAAKGSVSGRKGAPASRQSLMRLRDDLSKSGWTVKVDADQWVSTRV